MTTASNPAAPRGAQQRFGGPLGAEFRPFRGGESISVAMSAPTDPEKHCGAAPGRLPNTQYVVRCPAGCTGYKIHYGRWLEGPPFGAAGSELHGWLEVGTATIVAVGGDLASVSVPNYGDRTGIYVTDLSGTLTGTFRFWSRGTP